MTEPGREREGGQLTTPDSPPEQAARRQGDTARRTGTEGTNRDFDEADRSINQGHGHPREQRGDAEE
jgi:hypothetical protein